MRRLSIILSLLLIQGVVSAQDKVVTGRVVNERGDGIEYVSIGIPKDTVFTVSDTQGYFRLLIPAGKTEDVVFKHVSYETSSVSPEYCYSADDDMIVTLADNILPEAVVFPDAGKPVTVLGKGVRWAGCSFGLGNGLGNLKDEEWGSFERIRKPTRIDRAEIEARLYNAQKAVLSFVIYKVDSKESEFIPMQHVPVYQTIYDTDGKKNLVFDEIETLILEPGRYYFAIRFVEFIGKGSLDCQGYFKSAYDRNDDFKMPLSIGLKVTGTEYGR